MREFLLTLETSTVNVFRMKLQILTCRNKTKVIEAVQQSADTRLDGEEEGRDF